MMRKLLAYFDKATVLLYFAQSVFFGENKHKLIEEKNHNGKSMDSMDKYCLRYGTGVIVLNVYGQREHE